MLSRGNLGEMETLGFSIESTAEWKTKPWTTGLHYHSFFRRQNSKPTHAFFDDLRFFEVRIIGQNTASVLFQPELKSSLWPEKKHTKRTSILDITGKWSICLSSKRISIAEAQFPAQVSSEWESTGTAQTVCCPQSELGFQATASQLFLLSSLL